MYKEKVKIILIEIMGMLDAKRNETLTESQLVRKNLCFFLEGRNIPSVLPSGCVEKFVDIFKEESSKLGNDEIFFKGLLADVQTILDDISNDNISKSTKRLLGRLHMDCCFNAKLREARASSLTGNAIAIFDEYQA